MSRTPPPLPRRRSTRLPHWNYASAGAYFVTICTADRRHLFGTVSEGRMLLNPLGHLVECCWFDAPRGEARVTLDAFVVMPNHVHGVVLVDGSGDPGRFEDARRRFGESSKRSLGEVVRAFKAIATRLSRERSLLAGGTPLWQRGYWEHVVRSPSDLDRIREYVDTNFARWELDRENVMRTGRDDFDAWMESQATPPQSGPG